MSALRDDDGLPTEPAELNAGYNWREPDIVGEFRRRARNLQWIRANPGALPGLKLFYREHPAQFLNDWACTQDPRLIERGLPAIIPFVLFPKQVQWVEWIIARWKAQEAGLTEKSRDMGISWLAVSLACTLCLFYPGMQIGFGSRKEDYVDKVGQPKSLFWKGRFFMRHLPREFRGGWIPGRDAPRMRLHFRETGSDITGEAGDNIGRGDRTGIYFVDESAHIERQDLVEASLSATTNCRQDMSSVNGPANAFAKKRWSGRVPVFIFDWRDDPRKGQAWYDKEVARLDPITLAQEIDRDYNASVGGIVIPYTWVRAAVDAHLALGIEPTGEHFGALDVADEGKDLNAFTGGHGILINVVESWSGKGSDTFATAQHAVNLCDAYGYRRFRYDADGLGAFVRGDVRVINEGRRGMSQPMPAVLLDAFRGSEGVLNPQKEDVPGRKNEDYFLNRKAQSWWSLRTRFYNTYRWVTAGEACDRDDIISLSSKLPLLHQVCAELSQPTWDTNKVGKIFVDKTPEGMASPNLADSVMMRMAGNSGRQPIRISNSLLARA